MFAAGLAIAMSLISNPFTVRIAPVMAVQGGPIVVDAEVVYTGPKPVTVLVCTVGKWRGFEVDTPLGWASERTPNRKVFSFGPAGYLVAVKPGDTVTRCRIAIHEEFTGDIPPGPVPVTIRWKQGRDAKSDALIQASATVIVNVLPVIHMSK